VCGGNLKYVVIVKNLIPIFILLLFSCNNTSSINEEVSADTALYLLDSDTETNVIDEQSSISNIDNNSILKLPVIGTFDVSDMAIDSAYEYGTGDCWGNITQYSYDNIALGVDSNSCGDYGFRNTYYLLSKNGGLQVVYRKESSSFLSPRSNVRSYVRSETVVDFNQIPAVSYIRIDTSESISDFSIDQEFRIDTMSDTQTSYEHWTLEYEGLWTMHFDNM